MPSRRFLNLIAAALTAGSLALYGTAQAGPRPARVEASPGGSRRR